MDRTELISWILLMKDGDEKCTPQPDYARSALRWYHATLPEWDLMRGVAEALKNDPSPAVPRQRAISQPQERQALDGQP